MQLQSRVALALACLSIDIRLPHHREKTQLSCVAIEGDTCSYVPSSRQLDHPVATKLEDMRLRVLVWDMQLAPLSVQQKMRSRVQASYNTCDCDRA